MDLTDRLYALVVAVNGVTNIYPPRSPFERARTSTLMNGSPIVVKTAGDSITVDVRIGVHLSHPAPAVAETVAAAIQTHIRHAQPDATAINVNVQICSLTRQTPTGSQTANPPSRPGSASNFGQPRTSPSTVTNLGVSCRG